MCGGSSSSQSDSWTQLLRRPSARPGFSLASLAGGDVRHSFAARHEAVGTNKMRWRSMRAPILLFLGPLAFIVSGCVENRLRAPGPLVGYSTSGTAQATRDCLLARLSDWRSDGPAVKPRVTTIPTGYRLAEPSAGSRWFVDVITSATGSRVTFHSTKPQYRWGDLPSRVEACQQP